MASASRTLLSVATAMLGSGTNDVIGAMLRQEAVEFYIKATQADDPRPDKGSLFCKYCCRMLGPEHITAALLKGTCTSAFPCRS